MVTAVKAALEHHLSHQLLPIGEHKVQHDTSLSLLADQSLLQGQCHWHIQGNFGIACAISAFNSLLDIYPQKTCDFSVLSLLQNSSLLKELTQGLSFHSCRVFHSYSEHDKIRLK